MLTLSAHIHAEDRYLKARGSDPPRTSSLRESRTASHLTATFLTRTWISALAQLVSSGGAPELVAAGSTTWLLRFGGQKPASWPL